MKCRKLHVPTLFSACMCMWAYNRAIWLYILPTRCGIFYRTYMLYPPIRHFGKGENTGFKSFRTKVFDKFPRTGIPDYFSSIEEYDRYIKLLVKTNCIDNAKKIWWDIRVHPFFETIEFRICDCPMLIDETMAFVALFQGLCAKLYKMRQQNMAFMTYNRALINENKWRAARYGIDGKMIDFGKEMEVNTRSLVLELLDFIDDVVDELRLPG